MADTKTKADATLAITRIAEELATSDMEGTAAELLDALAALSAREGGEADDCGEIPRELWAWLVAREIAPDDTDGKVEWGEIVNALTEHEANLLHPAQPASQQGEDFEFNGYCGTCGSPCNEFGQSVHHFSNPQAHPTGDRVRGLVEKWRKEIAKPMHDANNPEEGAALCQLEICADELAAALDQEKGR